MTLSLHERIRSDIEADILSGALLPGARLPTEKLLMAQYGCSRMTVSKALTALSNAGLVDRRKRAGSSVSRPKVQSMVLDIPDLQVEVESRGQSYRYELTHQEISTPNPSHSDEVTLARNGQLLKLEGIHYADARPLAFEVRAVSLSAVPDIADVDFRRISPNAWLLQHIPWTEADLRLAAAAADGRIASMLDIPNGTACLMIERRTWRSDESITHVQQHFVGSEFDLIARFGPTKPKTKLSE